MQDYSQNGEQKILLNLFTGFIGRFLEIGACDGVLVSNTYALTQLGWSGVMVEPSPRAFLALQKLHGSNPKLSLVHAAVGLSHQMTCFWDSPSAEGYATTEEANRAKWQHLASFNHPFHLPLIPWSFLLQSFPGPYDFLSIDTEGTSTDLFLAFPFSSTLHPRAVCVEHDGRVQECLDFSTYHGYKEVARNGENLVLVSTT